MSKMIRWIALIAALLALWVSLALGQAAPAPTLDAAKKQAVIDEIASLFNKNYIFAETAKKVEEALRAKLKAGDFDKLAGAPEFAWAVAATILEVSKDRHTGFAFNPAMAHQKEQARAAGKFKKALNLEYDGTVTTFHGYDTLEHPATVLALYRDGSPVSELHASCCIRLSKGGAPKSGNMISEPERTARSPPIPGSLRRHRFHPTMTRS